jgi:hypothetical protein
MIASGYNYGEQQKQAGKRVSYGALYRTAIEDGWHVEQAQKNAQEEEKALKKREAEAQQRIAAEEKARAQQAAAHQKAERAAIMANFHTWPEDQKTHAITEFLDANPLLWNIYKRTGLDSPSFFIPFAQFLLSSNELPTVNQQARLAPS